MFDSAAQRIATGLLDGLGPPAPPPPLADFVEATTRFALHSWQRDHLIPALVRAAETPGTRLAVHAPPQFGKSVVVSQRFPAWLMGRRPTVRIGLACYNETHATGFGATILDLMRSPEFEAAFPDPEARLPPDAPAARFKTVGRARLRDAQPSFLAMGLQSGFTGKGVDLLLIDDPYKSDEEARSPAINEKVWRWWTRTASVRVGEEASVVVMFHRYHEDDLAGRLIASGFASLRFPAIADRLPGDPTGRQPGEPLSPMRSLAWLEAERDRDPFVFLGQFQGTPRPEEGAFFRPERIELADAAPAAAPKVRAWDLGGGGPGSDFSVGALLARDEDGRTWILDVRRGRWLPDDAVRVIRQTAETDGHAVVVRVPQDPGQAGKAQAAQLVRVLAGFPVRTRPVTGDKRTRAFGLAAQVNAGNVRMIRGAWNADLLAELRGFPLGAFDDQVDALADAFAELSSTASWADVWTV
ncbi:MAG: phage terminase large subunit [Fimbriimonadaceae bacterium]|nr:phage terminase large subunit [Fimbriimonadaceae bacterium]